MRLRNFRLFKLPIDSSYENVFDFAPISNLPNNNEFIIELIDKQSHLYPNLGFNGSPLQEFALDKAVNVNNNICSIVVPLDYWVVKDYNYIYLNCSINGSTGTPYSGQIFKSYFIEGYESLNDNESAPATRVTLSYDIWTNNYFDLNKGVYCKNAHILESHIHRWEEQSPQPNLTFRVTDLCAPRSVPPVADRLDTKNRKVVWAVYEYNVDYINARTYSPIESKQIGKLPYYGMFPYVFYPFRWVENSGFVASNFAIKWDGTYNGESKVDDLIVGSGISGFEANAIINNVYLTYYPPFEFDIGTDEDKTVTVHTNSDLFYVSLLNDAGLEYKGGGSHGFATFSPLANYVEVNRKQNYPTIPLAYVDGNRAVCEIPYQNYPYKYSYGEFQSGNKEFIGPQNFPVITVKVTPNSAGCTFSLLTQNMTNDFYKTDIIPVQQIGGVPFTVDGLAEYQRNNPSSFITNAIKSLIPGADVLPSVQSVENQHYEQRIHSAPNIRKLAYKQTINSERMLLKPGNIAAYGAGVVTNLMSLASQMYDLKNRPDTIKNGASFSPIMLYTLDRMILHNVEYLPSEIMDSDLAATHANGYIMTHFDSVLDNTRVLFDYCRADDFNPTVVSDYTERETLTRIFSNGVRKWHICNFTLDYYKDKINEVVNLNTEVVNPEIMLVKGAL